MAPPKKTGGGARKPFDKKEDDHESDNNMSSESEQSEPESKERPARAKQKDTDTTNSPANTVNYSKATVVDLKNVLRLCGLPCSGKKADLIARLTEADKTPALATTNSPAKKKPALAKRKTAEATDSPAQTETQPVSQAKKQKTDGAPSTSDDPKNILKTSEDLLTKLKLPPKRNLKTTPSVKWDIKADKPAGAIKAGYSKGRKIGTHVEQTPIPLQQHRLVPSVSTADVSQHAQSAASSELPDFVILEIDALLKQLKGRKGKLGLLKSFSQSYGETDFEKYTGKKRGKVVDPKSQSGTTHLNDTTRPFSSITDIFDDIADKADKMGFLRACEPFQKQGLRVVTMCSGTESPLIALDLLKRAFKDKSHLLNVRHLASAEIEPFKQAYIQRNFNPEVLFRDVTEFCDEHAEPHTAFGGTARQPDKVHMLVAGSSCIDYSTLNSKPKAFGEKGQSFSTLMGIANYCLRMKPAVVILENVDSAPWSQMLALLRDIGYLGLCCKVDTKDFYIPQTRTRGYIVAFHVSKARSRGFDLKEMFEIVTASLQVFKQRATVPYTHFIYNDDDPELSIARHKFVTAAKQHRESSRSWTACRHRYSAYRAELQLGFGKPFTQWRSDGSCLPLDITWPDWMRVQRERIWDTLDIKFLLYLRQREYDMSYKPRWLELSQNVDRDLDTRNWGITNCLTPSGMPMDSRRGGPVSGKETLALQGIPADKLLLNKETSSQLQDLAGNAMTTTVVGSVIFSAIIASMKKHAINSTNTLRAQDSIFEYFHNVPELDPEPVFELQTLEDIQNAAGRWKLQTVVAAKLQYQPPTMMEVGRRAASAMQLCRCEGALGKTNSKICICLQCGHTCCATCKGSPRHDYDEASNLQPAMLKSRATTRDFHEYAQKVFPPAIDLVQPHDKINMVVTHIKGLRDQLDTGKLLKSKLTTVEETEAYLNAISESLQHTLMFSGIKRDKIIRIIYESSTARLEFQIQFDLTKWLAERQEWTADLVECTWLLFAKPPKETGAGSPLREILEIPVLKMVPDAHLLDVALDFNTLEEQQMKLMISPYALSQETAWESTLGIQHPDYQNLRKWPELQVQVVEPHNDCLPVAHAIDGVYKSLSDCGGASRTLHAKVHPNKNQRGSKKEPQLSGMFLFLDPAPFRDARFDSMVFSNIHERLPCGVPRRVRSVIHPPWRPFQLQQASLLDATTEGTWKPSGLHLEASNRAGDVEVLGPTNPEISISSQNCDNYFSIAACRLPRFEHDSAIFPHNRTIAIELIDRPEALKTLQWLLRSKLNFTTLERWHNILYSISLVNDFSTCKCCPQAPRLKWRLATASVRESVIIKPFEDEQAASEYERRLKTIPVPVKAFLHCHQQDLDLDLELNLDSIVHRILAALQRGKRGKIKLQWRMKKDHGLENVPIFKQINVPGYESTDPHIGQTPGLEVSCILRPWQEQSVYWMEQQELDSVKWHEFQRMECKLPALEQRLDVEGTKEVHIKGGILADGVGSGKTLTSMVIPAREAVTNQGPDQGHEPGLLPLKATIFLIPSTLFEQWKDEKKKYIDKRVICLYIKSFDDLREYTIKDFQGADFIFVSWNLFEATTTSKTNPTYWDQLRKTTNAFNVPILAGRGFDQWLEEARNDLRDLVANSTTNGSISLHRFNKARKEKLETLKAKYKETFSAFRKAKASTTGAKQPKIVTKGIAGAAEQLENRQTELYQPAQPQARDDKKGALDCDEADWAGKDLEKLIPLLHMFSYRRIIVDEFTYLRDHTVSGIIHLSAVRRWMLSGTPPLHNYISISYMAKLLGTMITPQGDVDTLPNFIRANKALVHDKTSAEEFQLQLETQTPAWIRRRDERAEAFVKRFVRQSRRIVEEKREVKYHVKGLTLIESYLYTKAFQSVNGQPRETECVDKKKLQSKAIMDRDAAFITYQKKGSAVSTMVWCLQLLLEGYLTAFPNQASEDHDLVILRGLIKEKNEEFGSHVERIVLLLARALKAWQRKQASSGRVVGGEEEEEEEENEADVPDAGQAVLENKGDGKNSPLAVYLENVLDHNFGDRSVSGVVSRVVKACSLGLGAVCKGEDRVLADEKVASQKKLATDLNTLTREAVQIAQERRLLSQVLDLGLDREGTRKCHECERELTPLSLTVMSLCGHLVCTECPESESSLGEKMNDCPVSGCSGPGKDSSNPAVLFSSPASEVVSGGTKVSQLLQVVGAIRRDSPGERILVFVQGQFTKKLVKAVVEGFGGSSVVVNATNGSDLAVSRFGSNGGARILILPIDSINAAGWNLQSCNHVVFTHPYVSRTRADWEATMEQAIGRCARYGQARTVQVHHLLTRATLEMEIFQVRSGGRLVCSPSAGGVGWTFQAGASPDLSVEVVGPRLGSVEEDEEDEEE